MRLHQKQELQSETITPRVGSPKEYHAKIQQNQARI